MFPLDAARQIVESSSPLSANVVTFSVSATNVSNLRSSLQILLNSSDKRIVGFSSIIQDGLNVGIVIEEIPDDFLNDADGVNQIDNSLAPRSNTVTVSEISESSLANLITSLNNMLNGSSLRFFGFAGVYQRLGIFSGFILEIPA